MKIPPVRITKIHQQLCLKEQALALMAPSSRLEQQRPSLSRCGLAKNPGKNLESCAGRQEEGSGWLTEVVCVLAEARGLVLGVRWQLNIRRLAKGFPIRRWGLKLNAIKEVLMRDILCLKNLSILDIKVSLLVLERNCFVEGGSVDLLWLGRSLKQFGATSILTCWLRIGNISPSIQTNKPENTYNATIHSKTGSRKLNQKR